MVEELAFTVEGAVCAVRLARPACSVALGVVLCADAEVEPRRHGDRGWEGLADHLAATVPGAVALLPAGPGLAMGRLVGTVRAAARALRNDERCDGRVALAGFGLGAAAALTAAAGDARLHAIAALAAPVDLPQAGYGSEAHLTRLRTARLADPPDPAAWRREFIAHSPVHHLARLEGRSLLVVHGMADAEVPARHAELLAQATGARLRLLPTAGHRLHDDRVAVEELVSFLRAAA